MKVCFIFEVCASYEYLWYKSPTSCSCQPLEFIKKQMKNNHFNLVHQHLGLILFIIAFIIALFTYENYGMSWDEPMQKRTGEINYDYIFSNDNSLLTWKDRDYGVAFEVPLIIIEKVLNLNDSRDIFTMRHLVTHCFFLISCYFLFLLIDYLYKNKLLATVGFLFLLLHPRIYAHSFFNSKDIPFLSMLIICLYYSVKAFDKKSTLRFIGLGMCVGVLINLRIMGVLILLSSLLILVIDLIKTKEKKTNIKLIAIFLISTCLTLYVTWPFLWGDPFKNFVFTFQNMARFRWDSTVLFNGEEIKATKLDWKYIPTWFSITTPVIYLLLGFTGFLLLIFRFIKHPKEFIDNSIKRTNLIFLGYFLAPLIAVIVFQSVLYDGWRQMYFIYPPFILLCIYSVYYLINKSKRISTLTLVCIFGTFILTLTSMIRVFPLQNVYFNELFYASSPEYLRKNFEMDYWGVSYKQSLEYILKVDSSPSIDVSVENLPGQINVDMLTYEERTRINIVPKDSATYFITNYRWHPKDYNEYKNFKFHSLSVGENTVSQIFKFK